MPRLPLPPIAPFLYAEEMHGLIEEKKSRRENLNIFILSAEELGIKNYSELSFFFKLLSKNINDYKTPSRFQLAIESQGHWFSVDCYIKNNQLYLLVLDASVNDISTEIIKEAALSLKPIIFSYRGVQIQYDFERCSFFTLDHLLRLSNRTQHWNDLLNFNSPAREKIIYFDHKSCPNSLAFIFKNMQSFKALDKLSGPLRNSFINKHKTTLDQFITENSRSRNFLGVEDKINAGIILKEKKYMERGTYFFKPANYRKIASSRQGFEVIGGKLGEIIKEINVHKGKTYLKFFIKENKTLIKDNIRDIFDVAVWYDLKNLLVLLTETKLLSRELITVSDICNLINQNLSMFKIIFEHAKDALTSTDISKIKHKINFIGNDQFKQYFSSVAFEETDDPYSSIFLPF